MVNVDSCRYLRILVVDDDELTLAMFQTVLSFKNTDIISGLTVSDPKNEKFESLELMVCRQGDEAVEIVKHSLDIGQPFAVVFLDIQMPPGPDGIWTGERIRELDPQIEIIIVTGESDVNLQNIARRIPPVHKLLYLQKPFHPQEIAQFTSALGMKWRAEYELRAIHHQLETLVEERTHELRVVNEQLKQDIAQREKAEDALKESETRYSELFRNAHDMIQSVAPDGRFLFANPAWFDKFGYTEADLPDLNFFQLIHPDSLEHCQESFSKVMQGEAIQNVEAIFQLRTGRHITVEGNAVPRYLDGEVVAMHGFFRDITTRKKAEERLHQLQEAIETMQIGVIITDLEGTITYTNIAEAEMHGYEPEELLGQNMNILQPSRLRKPLGLSEIAGWMGLVRESTHVRKDGTTFPVWLMSEIVIDHQGEPWALVTSCEDITERKQAEEALRKSEERNRIILESAPDPIAVYDMKGRIMYVNPAFSRVFGWELEESIGTRLDFVPIENRRDTKLLFEKIRQGQTVSGFETLRIAKNGKAIDVSISGTGFFDRDGKLQGSVITLQDITRRKQQERDIKFLAYHDALTGLLNRKSFYSRLEDELVRSFRPTAEERRLRGEKWALLFLDLDNFKNVNDSLGHEVGDQLLKSVAFRIRESVRKCDYIFRLGGDEFTIILHHLATDTDVAKVAQKIRKDVAKPYSIQNHTLYATASVGIGFYPQDGDNVETLVKNAETAMYVAKNEGEGYRFFSEDMNKKALERMTLENHLRIALQQDQFLVYYQPLVDQHSQLVGMEALVRWNHPEWGLVNPGRFIPIAEETGLIVPLGDWVLQTACEQIVEWREMGYNGLTVAVNLSTRQFREPDLIETIERVLEATGLPSHHLKVEVTESGIMDNPEQAIERMQILRKRGIRFSIDDFGTGYSSLSYLKRFPIDTLKIDRSFVIDCPTDKDDQEIIKTIIAMARNLNMNTVAEGIETEEQRDFLIEQGCQFMQGYYYGKPMPPEQFLADLLHKPGTQSRK